jgi:hypothetical protein
MLCSLPSHKIIKYLYRFVLPSKILSHNLVLKLGVQDLKNYHNNLFDIFLLVQLRNASLRHSASGYKSESGCGRQ